MAALLLTLALTACSSGAVDKAASTSPSSAVRSYVGAAEGTDAFVAVVVDERGALAYVCDGVPRDPVGAPPTVQAWFNGTFDGRVVDVQQPAGRLVLQLTATDMAGTLTLAGGRTVAVSGRVVTGDAGLYRAESSGPDGKAVGGWILASDGQQRGGVGVETTTGTKLSGVRVLNLSQPTFTLQGLASSRIAKVGITPIPIP